MNESGQWSAMSANNPPFGFVRARVRGAMGAGRGEGAGRAARGCDGRPARAFARRRQNSPGGGHRHGPVRAGFPAGTPKGDDDGKARKTPPLRAWERPGEWTPRGGGGVGRRAAPRMAGRWRIRAVFRPNPPNADGRAEKRFPCCAVRRWTRRALARAFGEFAPCADSGLRQADGGGGGMCRGCGLRRALIFSANN